MMAAHCAGATHKIRFGTGVVVVPLYHPARLLEEIAFVDILSEGRLVLGLGSGYQDYEFQRFNAKLADSKKYFTETLDVIEMAFRDGAYAYDGQYIRMPPTPIAIRPLQQPLPIYIAGLYGDEDIQRRLIAAGHVPFATAGWRSAEVLAGLRKKYDETARSMGHDPAAMPFAVQRYVYVTDSREDALAAAEHVRYTGRIAQSMRNKYFELEGSFLREIPAKDEPSLEQIVDNAIIGDVETCIERAVREIEVLQPSHFSCFMQFGSLDIRKVRRSMELFGERVIPALERRFGSLDAIGMPRTPAAATA
jgi:alkanesulfonate monooxygenase SsuD/methylene tetrahydromethanopterin reductase-like flavin-dependent oxidoreductase (luciferase family)